MIGKIEDNKDLIVLANFISFKKDKRTEYSLNLPNGNGYYPIPAMKLNGYDINKFVINSDEISFLSDKYVEMLSPDNINTNLFWGEAIRAFPCYSIGGSPDPDCPITTPTEINGLTFSIPKESNALTEINFTFMENPDTRFLEIGPGYGNMQGYIANNFGDENYYAIDVVELFNHPRLYLTDGSTIPSTIPYPMDMVYSLNVFQHLSKKQRTSYYKQIYEILDIGGSFIFGMFVITEENKDWPHWGLKDKDGNSYVGFFNQFTKVDTYEELMDELKSIGFHVRQLSKTDDKSHYFTFKCTKTYD